MALERFHIVQGDTLPALTAVVQDDAGTPMDLGDVTAVQFHLLTRGTRELLVDDAGEVVDAQGGVVGYDWSAGDTDRAGLHRAEFQLTFTGGLILTVPNAGEQLVEITPQLA